MCQVVVHARLPAGLIRCILADVTLDKDISISDNVCVAGNVAVRGGICIRGNVVITGDVLVEGPLCITGGLVGGFTGVCGDNSLAGSFICGLVAAAARTCSLLLTCMLIVGMHTWIQ